MRGVKGLVGGIALAVFAYLLLVLWGGWHDIVSAISRIGLLGVCMVLALSLLNYALRLLRWQAYLGALSASLDWRTSGQIYFAGFALTVTPGKVGESVRGWFLHKCGVPFHKTLSALLSEKLSDLLAVILLTLAGGVLLERYAGVIFLSAAAVLMVLMVLAHPAAMARLRDFFERRRSRFSRLTHYGLNVLAQTEVCHRPVLFSWSLALSLVAWGAEAVAFYLVLHWMSVEIALPLAVSIYAFSTLAGAISFIPGGIGGAEAVMILLLAGLGVPQTEAIAATVLIRLATLWFAVALGGAFLVHCNRKFNHHKLVRGPIEVERTRS